MKLSQVTLKPEMITNNIVTEKRYCRLQVLQVGCKTMGQRKNLLSTRNLFHQLHSYTAHHCIIILSFYNKIGIKEDLFTLALM